MEEMNFPNWRKIVGIWHFEVVAGAHKTACRKEIPPNAPSSTESQATPCTPCRNRATEVRRAARDVDNAGLRVQRALEELKGQVRAMVRRHGRETVLALPKGAEMLALVEE